MIIVKAKKENLVEIHKLLLDIFPNAKVELGKNDEFFLARDGGIVGFAHFTGDGKRIILKGIGITKKNRGTGIGSALLEKMIAFAKKKGNPIYLKVKINDSVVRFYCKKGFCFKRLNGEVCTMVLKIVN